MVDDKISKRATGPISSLMRCPTEGRSKGGGPKIGTMEKDVFVAGDSPMICMIECVFHLTNLKQKFVNIVELSKAITRLSMGDVKVAVWMRQWFQLQCRIRQKWSSRNSKVSVLFRDFWLLRKQVSMDN